jgi:hypothetical protein
LNVSSLPSTALVSTTNVYFAIVSSFAGLVALAEMPGLYPINGPKPKVGGNLLNRMTGLGMPVSARIR